MLESENDSSMLKSSTIHLEFEIDSLLKPRTFHLHTESIHSQKPLANRQPILAHFWDQIYWTRERWERFFLWVYGIYEYKICLKTLRTVAHRLKPIFHLPFFMVCIQDIKKKYISWREYGDRETTSLKPSIFRWLIFLTRNMPHLALVFSNKLISNCYR